MIRRLLFTILVAGFVLAGTAQAAVYGLLPTSGGQAHIGNGLALPIQPAIGNIGSVFPPLLVPPVPGATVTGTTTATMSQKIGIPAGVLFKGSLQNTVGVYTANTMVFAVGTNLTFSWPTAPAVLSTGARTGAAVTTVSKVGAGTMVYTAPLSGKFGGPARFSITKGPAPPARPPLSPGHLIPGAGVTVYINFNAVIPPCTHPGFGGAATVNNSGCVAILVTANVAGPQAIGGPLNNIVSTFPVAPAPGIVLLKAGAAPPGTISVVTFTPGGAPSPILNGAVSQAGPWTVGQIVVSAPIPVEKFTLTGMDSRTTMGAGSIQLVSGSVSTRTTSGPNGNRGWIRLDLQGPVTVLPAMSPGMRGFTVVLLIMLAAGYALRPRLAQRS